MKFELMARLLGGFSTSRVLVLGDVMLDRFIYGSADRISPEAPIPVFNIQRSLDMPGGAANVARNIAAMGSHAMLLGVVGDDDCAQDLRVQLASWATIDAHLVVDASRPTSVKTRYVANGQQVMRADRESRDLLPSLTAECLLAEFSRALPNADIVVLSDYAKGVLSDVLTRAAIDIARRAGKTIIVDPKSKTFAKYSGATVITPNQLELQEACGQECLADDQVADGALRILERGVCDSMVVTRGRDGISVIQAGGKVTHLPSAERQVFDVSGAGDTVVALMALGLAAGADIIDAAALGNIAAGIVVGKRGTATVTAGEMIATLRPFDGRTDPAKIFALDTVLQLALSWREQGLKIAFANGCFDLLHPGHISLLDQARRSADRLIVGLNSDSSIRRLKGPNRPVQNEVARATVLSAVKSVDAVVIFAEDTPIDLIEALAPDVLVKGSDYALDQVVGADLVIRRGGKVVLAEILAGHSTSDTVTRAGSSGS